MDTIHVIGGGRVGKTLARLWTQRRVFRVGGILNRSLASAEEAARFIGGGQAVERYADLPPAPLVMISTSDESIESCCQALCREGVVAEGTVVFHCSGALPSSLLEPARRHGARIASIHPVKSFADPRVAAETFAGTPCAVEGDPGACAVLREALERCGGVTFPIQPGCKTLYHAATVMVCNYLVALLEAGFRCFERAGVPRETAARLSEPIVRETVEHVFRLGTAAALTGPVARGEVSVVAAQARALGQQDATLRQIYGLLGHIAADLAAAQQHAPPEALAEIRRLLQP